MHAAELFGQRPSCLSKCISIMLVQVLPNGMLCRYLSAGLLGPSTHLAIAQLAAMRIGWLIINMLLEEHSDPVVVHLITCLSGCSIRPSRNAGGLMIRVHTTYTVYC